jgi:capsular polysaccharide transport system permease protein
MTPPPDDNLAAAPRLRPVERLEPPAVEAEPPAVEAEPPAEDPPARKRPRPRKKGPARAPARRRRATPKPEPLEVPPPELAAPDPMPARAKPRHWGMLASFVLLVLAPFAVSVWYLYARAANQYHSEVAFSIRSEEGSSSAAAGLLGALTKMGAGSASDTDVLFEYIRSQKIVEEIDAQIDLREMYRRADDPVFALGSDPSIEALLGEWRRMVEVSYDSSGGIIHVRANAFTPQDARAIASAILAHSGALVNRLSDQAREDAVRFARQELAEAEANLRAMRQRVADFRRDNRIVDPSADAAGQMGLLNALQAQLAQALVDRDVMLSYAEPNDQRVLQVNRRVDAIGERIEAERASLGIAEGKAGTLPQVIGAYEELQVDMEFANTAYTQALGGLTAARAEARRQSRYLAPHIEPTFAESALYPRRVLLAGLTGLFLLLGWGIAMLVYYNVHDNR